MLYQSNAVLQFVYVILFGKVRLYDAATKQKLGNLLNIGWTIGEEILFGKPKKKSIDMCKSITDSCLLAISQENLNNIKK